MSPMPIVKLSNGLLVGNFSSGHAFEFTDGTILPACSNDRVEAGALMLEERPQGRSIYRGGKVVRFQTIKLGQVLSPSCHKLLQEACIDYTQNRVHIVLVARMVVEALQDSSLPVVWRDFCFSIRKDGRDTKDARALIHIDKFCE